MEWKCVVVITVLLLIVTGLAGCTGSPPAPVATPVPLTVTTTVMSTPAPAGTAAPVTTTAAGTPETPAPDHPYAKTYSFEGTGDDVQSFTTTSGGTWIFRMNYPGEEVFIVRLLDDHGDSIEELANEGGSYTGTKSVQMVAGTYYLDVSAAAPWTITMSAA